MSNPGTTRLARLALALYPPSWRARYGDEVHAFLQQRVHLDAALALSIAAAGLGGLPLWLLMLRRAHREDRRRDVAYLLAPLMAPAAFLAGLAVTVRLVGGADGVSAWWFLVLTLVGYHHATIPGVYLALVVVAAAVTAVSAARGVRAALADREQRPGLLRA